jgi:YfiH family protein
MWLLAPNINCKHGFSTRWGGISKEPFANLNLGGQDEDASIILENRTLALQHLNLSIDNLCYLKQVHGNVVRDAAIGQLEGDALVTNKQNLVLAISVADCYPIVFYDEVNKVIGAAHAGWRGTVGKIAENTINKMLELGANVNTIKVAIGQGICQDRFEVGNEVIEEFEKSGFPKYCWEENKIDLIACNTFVLQENNISKENIWTMNRCSFEDDFFSYRRDKGKTGRMWAIITLP